MNDIINLITKKSISSIASVAYMPTKNADKNNLCTSIDLDKFASDDYKFLNQNMFTFLHNDNFKTLLISCLTTQQSQKFIIQQLTNLYKYIIHHNAPTEWNAKIINTPSEPYVLTNLFLTNNKLPQVANLGIACVHANLADDTCYQLCMPQYFWHTINPSLYYRKQIINLDQSINFEQAMHDLDLVFNKILKHECEQGELSSKLIYQDFKANDIMVDPALTILDFEWLMNNLFTINYTESINLNSSDLNYILQYLSTKLD